MKLENQVCSLESARRLKELGVKQESLFGWALAPKYKASKVGLEPTNESEWIVVSMFKNRMVYSAFTVAELGEMLPEKPTYSAYRSFWFSMGMWCSKVVISGNEYHIQERTEAEARAKMLIYLIENNLCPSDRKDG